MSTFIVLSRVLQILGFPLLQDHSRANWSTLFATPLLKVLQSIFLCRSHHQPFLLNGPGGSSVVLGGLYPRSLRYLKSVPLLFGLSRSEVMRWSLIGHICWYGGSDTQGHACAEVLHKCRCPQGLGDFSFLMQQLQKVGPPWRRSLTLRNFTWVRSKPASAWQADRLL